MIGRTLSHFEVIEKLGEGGMGVVYKARDTQLNRFVALKLLSPGRMADPERRRRFIQEARAASALSHPNIVTIYEISQSGPAEQSPEFIAMEYVAGRTLDQLIPRHGMKVSEALRVAVQIANGLARAHAAGIVHRDLKPSNIIVGGGEGDQTVVKILDFGLAKLSEAVQDAEEATMTVGRMEDAVRTDSGAILGTVAYMSPEQAEGKPVDARTDIFAFGAVLYEMLSGRRAFAGASKQATLAAVMRDEPPAIPHIPHELEKLIARCLRKDPARRAQHMADLKLALEELKEESESGFSTSGFSPATASSRRRWLVPALAALVLLSAAGLFWKGRGKPERAAPEMQSIVLTSYAGAQSEPALSPDGKQVAFSWRGEKGDNSDIYVKLVDAGTAVRLTTDPNADSAPAWSPDGRFLAFTRLSDAGQGGYYVIPALGGPERKVADIPQTPTHRPYPSADWTPDSKSLVIVDTSVDPPALAQVSIADRDKRPLTNPPQGSYGDYLPVVSPNGQWLTFDRVPAVSVQEQCVVPFSQPSKQPLRMQFGGLLGGNPARCAWTADSAQLICAEGLAGGARLVRMPVPGPGKAQAITAAGTNAFSPSIARQGGRAAYVHAFRSASLWRADLLQPKTPAARAIASTRSETQPDFSPDGGRIAFISSRSGDAEVWTARVDGSDPVQITTQAARPTAPRWSPDGRRIAFAQRPGGNVDIYVVDAQGGTPRRMTTDPAGDASAYWSRDGKWIYFASNRTGRQEVWKLPADGSAPEVQVTRNGGWRSRESFDGRMLYFQKFDQPGLFRMQLDGGAEERIAEIQPPEDWQLLADAVLYLRKDREGYTVARVDLNSAKTSDALKLPPGTAGGTSNFTVSPDGRWLVFVHGDQMISELMMIENFR